MQSAMGHALGELNGDDWAWLRACAVMRDGFNHVPLGKIELPDITAERAKQCAGFLFNKLDHRTTATRLYEALAHRSWTRYSG